MAPIGWRRLPVILLPALLTGLQFCSSGTALATTTPTVILQVVVHSSDRGQDDAVNVTNLNSDVLGTCQLPARATAKRISCAIRVPANTSVLVTAQPAAGQTWQSFHGSKCSSAPGPVCHIAITEHRQLVSARFGRARPGPSVTSASPLTYAHSPTMSFGDNTVTVNGTGFPANQAATLTDDGATVATGATDANGDVTLTYDSQSEPGVYRKLAIHAGGKTAQTDVYNTLVWAWGEGDQGSGSIFFVINETDMDAHRTDNYVSFDSNPRVPMTFADGSASKGYAQIDTPHYSCPKGAAGTLRIYGTRGSGPQRYTYNFLIPITC
jgi:hypothetical protein